ncbi:MAG: hypothetical protein NT118_10455 [Lentisphaerae bacterium]|nr:hypothetical protein [Lentisphaerota bacterium]
MLKPKLRDSKKSRYSSVHSLGDFSEAFILEISKWIVYNFAIGKADINGEDWGDIFSKGIKGEHLSSPVGLADVVMEDGAWSVKSVKANKPHDCKTIRVISGRNSPDYSYGITDPHEDPQKTGTAVLNIWNERVNIAIDEYVNLRAAILIRNFNALEFTLFETEINRFVTKEYSWTVNDNGNLEGLGRTHGDHKFTWQPHGSQFTTMYSVPSSAVRFQLKRPPILDFNKTMEEIGFDKSWICIKK